MRSYEAQEASRLKHKVTHRHENGLMWSSCACGWESPKLDSYHNYQVTQSRREGEDHRAWMIRNEDAA